MSLYGVIDLGSNSIRLVVYDAKEPRSGSGKPIAKKDFKSIINEKKIAGLAAYVQDGVFTRAGIDRAVDVLQEHLKHARNLNCDRISVFATAVLRNCSNSAEAVRAISDAIGLPIDLLSEHDEAHLGFVGATCDRTIDNGTLIDIGGGSTELTAIVDGKDTHGVSLGQGSVSSYAQFVNMILPTDDEMHAIEDAFKDRLATLGDLDPYRATRLYGIGGSTRAISKMYGMAFCSGVRPKLIELHQVDALLTMLARNRETFAHIAVKAVPDRLHTLVPGCLITITLMRELGARSIEICKYGVREGYLIERILKA